MCENLHYEFVYFQRTTQRPRILLTDNIYRAEAAVVSNCTSIEIVQSLRVPAPGYESWSPDSILKHQALETLKDKHSIFKTVDYYSTIPRKIVSLSKKVNLPQNRQLAQFYFFEIWSRDISHDQSESLAAHCYLRALNFSCVCLADFYQPCSVGVDLFSYVKAFPLFK